MVTTNLGTVFSSFDDGEISYNILFEKSYYVWYRGNYLYVPFIKNVTYDSISVYYEEIKNELLRLNDIYDDLPKLKLCKLPTHKDFNSKNEILLSNGDCIYYGNSVRVIFHQIEENIDIDIYHDKYRSNIMFKNMSRSDNIYNFSNKITIINQPFNAELFAESIRTYTSDYLTILFSIFKPNKTKSSRLN